MKTDAMQVTPETIDYVQTKAFRAAEAGAIFTQLYLHRNVGRDELWEVSTHSLARELVWLSNKGRKPVRIPDPNQVYQQHKKLIDEILAEAFETADAMGAQLKGQVE